MAVEDKIVGVTCPGLPGDASYELAQKYLKCASGVTSLSIRGGRDAAIRFMNALNLASGEVCGHPHLRALSRRRAAEGRWDGAFLRGAEKTQRTS